MLNLTESRSVAASTSSARRHLALIVTVLGVAAICSISISAAPAPMVAPWDVLVLLDGGYRMSLGQVPGIDFGNPVGPLVYGLTSLGMRWEGRPSLASVAYGNVLFVTGATALAWYCTRDRLGPAWRAGSTLFIALMLVAVRPLGYSPSTTSYAMLYNRYGWALLSVATVMVLIEPKRPAGDGLGRSYLDAFVLGLVLGLAFYTKVTFAAAVVVLVVRFCVGRGKLARLAATTGGLLVVAVACYLVWGVDPWHYLRDVMTAGRVQSGSARGGQLVHALVWSAPALLTMLVLGALLALAAHRAHLPRTATVRLAEASAAVVVFALVLTAGDANERGELPLLAVVPALVVSGAAWKAARDPKSRADRRLRPALAVALTLVVLATAGRTVVEDGVSVAEEAAEHQMVAAPPAAQRIDSADLADFVIPPDDDYATAYRTAKDVPLMLDDGIALLRGAIAPKDRVFTMGFGNPFNLALELTPTRGGLLWYDLGYDVDDDHFPDPAITLGDADWVVVPLMVQGQGCCQSTVAAMLHAYSPYLRTNFTLTARSTSWELWKRTRR